MPAQARGGEVEGMVRDAAVGVDAAHVAILVVGRLDEVLHVRGLGVLAEAGVVVGGAGGFHGAERDALDAGEEAVFADEPVGGRGGLLQVVLLDHDAEDVGDGFVEGAGLGVVGEGGGVFGYAVGELVGGGRGV